MQPPCPGTPSFLAASKAAQEHAGFPCVMLQPGCLKETSSCLQLFLSSCVPLQHVTAHCLRWQSVLQSCSMRRAIKCEMMLLLLKKFISCETSCVGQAELFYFHCLRRGLWVNTCCMQRRGKAGTGCLQCPKSMRDFSGAGWSWVSSISALFCFLVCSIHIGLN